MYISAFPATLASTAEPLATPALTAASLAHTTPFAKPTAAVATTAHATAVDSTVGLAASRCREVRPKPRLYRVQLQPANKPAEGLPTRRRDPRPFRWERHRHRRPIVRMVRPVDPRRPPHVGEHAQARQ